MKILWGTMLLLAMASAGCDGAAPEPEAPVQAASPDIMACAESVAGPEASAGSTREDGMNKPIDKVEKTDDEWRDLLSPEQFRIARMKGTERAFTGAYWDEKTPGVYQCVACALPLFDSGTKFDSGTGWPSFFKPLEEHHVAEETDHSHGMVRTEVLCARCDAHLGHVFQDGPEATGLRYCINSASLTLVPREEEAE